MFFSSSLFSAQTEDLDLQTIAKLNNRRSKFISKRSSITMQMVKGILDYHCLSKDKFLWRFETVFNKEQEPQIENDQDQLSDLVRQTKGEFLTPEMMYNNMSYLTDDIVKDKVDEIYNEITSREYELEVKSMPYQDQKYIVQALIKQAFQTPQAELAWKQAVFDSLTKNTGFLRTIIVDKNNKHKLPSISYNQKGGYDLKWTEVKKDIEITTEIVSIDPETVFIDPATENPQECFIITPYEEHELLVKFPFLKDCITDSDGLDLTDEGEGKNCSEKAKYVFKETPYLYHAGEALIELYNSKDLGNSIFSETSLPLVNLSNNSFKAFKDGAGAGFWNSAFNQNTSVTKLRRQNYFLNEYYNVAKDLYVCWVGNVILYQGPILEPYKEIPLIPVYSNKKNRGYYGELFTDNLVQYQDEYNEIRHQQRLVSKLLGKPLLIVDDDRINADYHPNKQFNLADYNPFTLIHSQSSAVAEQLNGGGPPVMAVNLNYGSDNILEARKARLIAEMEKKYPNIKSLAMNSNPEMQREMIWSRDLNVNIMLQSLALQLSQLAAKVFATRIFELSAMAGKDLPIPAFQNSETSVLLFIQDTNENSIKQQLKVAEAFDAIYQDQVNKAAQQISEDGQTVPALQEQVMQQIMQQVLEGMGQLGTNPEEQEQVMQAAMQNPKVMATVQNLYNKEGKDKIYEIILQQAETMVEKPVDNNMYLSFQKLDNILRIQKEFNFSFKKSIKEQQAAMQTFLAMAQPLQSLLPQILQPKGFLQELCIMQGLDPNKIIIDKVPTPSDMIQMQNTKMYFGADKTERIAADFYNKLRGNDVVTYDQLISDYQVKKQIDTEANIAQAQAREQAKSQASVDVNQISPVENQAIPQENNQPIPQENNMQNELPQNP